MTACPSDPSTLFAVSVKPHETQFRAAVGQTVLAAALQAGHALPSSCRNGTCRACMCRLLAGQVSYLIEWPGLLAPEKAQGYILPCVACATSDLVITYE